MRTAPPWPTWRSLNTVALAEESSPGSRQLAAVQRAPDAAQPERPRWLAARPPGARWAAKVDGSSHAVERSESIRHRASRALDPPQRRGVPGAAQSQAQPPLLVPRTVDGDIPGVWTHLD